jgi:hypothetical protein
VSVNPEEELLREMLQATYREIAPSASGLAETLCRRLAAGLYRRGGRIQLGDAPVKYHHIHISVDRHDQIVWTCANFHRALGYRPHALINKPVGLILTPDSASFRREWGLPELVAKGKLGPVVATFIRYDGQLLAGPMTATILRDSTGAFLRTFSRIKVPAGYLEREQTG